RFEEGAPGRLQPVGGGGPGQTVEQPADLPYLAAYVASHRRLPVLAFSADNTSTRRARSATCCSNSWNDCSATSCWITAVAALTSTPGLPHRRFRPIASAASP